MKRKIDDFEDAISISVGRQHVVITHVDIPGVFLYVPLSEIEAGKAILDLVTEAAVEKDLILSLNELSLIADAIKRMV